jgi:hypothetical protein
VFLQIPQPYPQAVAAVVGSAVAQAAASNGYAGVAAVAQRQVLIWRPASAGDGKRVVIDAFVCLRQGYLEHLLSNRDKIHESLLAADIDALTVGAALVAIGAKPGKPVQFVNDKQEPDFKPPTGEKIKVILQYESGGKIVTVPAQRWIRSVKTKKELSYDWVFVGSPVYPREGRFICMSNFLNALLDLPIKSEEGDPQAGLDFEANMDLIPPLGTKVTVILERVEGGRQ